MKTKRDDLIQELQREGAPSGEAVALAKLASQLHRLHDLPPRSLNPQGTRPRPELGWTLLGGLVAALFLAILIPLSWRTLPGELLHPVKSGAQALAVAVDPDLRPSVMMDRSREVAQLAIHQRPPSQILRTLGRYNQLARQVRGDQYAAWLYCREELEVARDHTQGGTRTAIEHSLKQTPAPE